MNASQQRPQTRNSGGGECRMTNDECRTAPANSSRPPQLVIRHWSLVIRLLFLPLGFGLWSLTFAAEPRPNIVFLLADDLGWADVGFNGGEIRTPNLDALAARGTLLRQFYVQPLCTPTRASLMTGRYPMRHGLQSGVIKPGAEFGLPLAERTLASALREAGYTTALCGKWHLGHHDRAYLPTARGFDHQYGLYNGSHDYFTHERDGGLDWHRDDRPLREEGYATHLIAREAARLIAEHDPAGPFFLLVAFNAPHTPLQVPENYTAPYRHLKEEPRWRRRGCAATRSSSSPPTMAGIRQGRFPTTARCARARAPYTRAVCARRPLPSGRAGSSPARRGTA